MKASVLYSQYEMIIKTSTELLPQKIILQLGCLDRTNNFSCSVLGSCTIYWDTEATKIQWLGFNEDNFYKDLHTSTDVLLREIKII